MNSFGWVSDPVAQDISVLYFPKDDELVVEFDNGEVDESCVFKIFIKDIKVAQFLYKALGEAIKEWNALNSMSTIDESSNNVYDLEKLKDFKKNISNLVKFPKGDK